MLPGATFRKTRLAPTPSGYLHIGNALSFVITAGLAEQTGARILLRIDDRDRDRMLPEFVDDIFETLQFLGIPWHEGPTNRKELETAFSQLHRMNLYRDVLNQLRDDGHVYACSCPKRETRNDPEGAYRGTCRHKNVPLDTPGVAWRLRTDSTTAVRIKTPDGKETIEQLPAHMHDFIVRRRDGFPAYQLTSVVDDTHFGIDLIVRGQDLWPSTLAQICLATALGIDTFLQTAFYHHPLLHGPDGDKLSKSAGATSIQHLRKEGRTKEEVYGILGAAVGVNSFSESWQELYGFLGV